MRFIPYSYSTEEKAAASETPIKKPKLDAVLEQSAKGKYIQEMVCLSKFQRFPWSVYDPLRDQVNFGFKQRIGLVDQEMTIREVMNLKDYDPLSTDQPYQVIRDSAALPEEGALENLEQTWIGPLDFQFQKRTCYQTVLYEPSGRSIISCTGVRPFDIPKVKTDDKGKVDEKWNAKYL